MRKLAQLLLLLIAPTLFAQSADLGIVSFTTTKSAASTGERFVAAMRWHNFGPETATSITATIGGDLFAVQGAGTDNWPCVPSSYGKSFTCQGASLAPGGEAEMIVTFLAPPNTQSGATFSVDGSVTAATADAVTSNNHAQLSLGLTAANERADLSVTNPAASYAIARGGSFSIPFTITNSGPSTAHQLIAFFEAPMEQSIRLTASGSGWNCAQLTHSPQLWACLAPSLAAGASSNIDVGVTAPPNDLSFPVIARVRAENGFDPNGANDVVAPQVDAGTTAAWKRILVPLIPSETPGANGSLWKTQTMILVRNPAAIEIKPDFCDYTDVLCIPTPLVPPQRQVDLADYIPVGAPSGNDLGGAFVYVRENDESNVALNSRVWDVAKESETAGSEIPVVRESDFASDTISLLGIPVAAQYRHTLRVYDFAGQNGARVRIDVFANDEKEPRASVERTLGVSPLARVTTPASLPTHPAYLQLDPATLTSIAGFSSLRIDVTPLDDGMRIWSFASITNNTTHHVTTFSAQ